MAPMNSGPSLLAKSRDEQGSELRQRHSDFLWFFCPVATGVLHCPGTGRTSAAPSPSCPTANGSHHTPVSLACPLNSGPDPLHPSPLRGPPPRHRYHRHPLLASANKPWHPAIWAWELIKAFNRDQRQRLDRRHHHRQQIDAWWDHANEAGGG